MKKFPYINLVFVLLLAPVISACALEEKTDAPPTLRAVTEGITTATITSTSLPTEAPVPIVLPTLLPRPEFPLISALRETISEDLFVTLGEAQAYRDIEIKQIVDKWLAELTAYDIDESLALDEVAIHEVLFIDGYRNYSDVVPAVIHLEVRPRTDNESLWVQESYPIDEFGNININLVAGFIITDSGNLQMVDIWFGPPNNYIRKYDQEALETLGPEAYILEYVEKMLTLSRSEGIYISHQIDIFFIQEAKLLADTDNIMEYQVTFSAKPSGGVFSHMGEGMYAGTYSEDSGWLNDGLLYVELDLINKTITVWPADFPKPAPETP